MTDTERSLLTAVCAAPADDLPRLIAADWFEENGETERAEWIRLQCQIASIGEPTGEDRKEVDDRWEAYDRMRHRSFEMLCDNSRRWFGERYVPYADSVLGTHRLNTIYGNDADIQIDVRRGFPDTLAATLAEFMGGACERCRPARERLQYRVLTHTARIGDCPDCHGTGKREGLADVAAREMWPITKVALTDREPFDTEAFGWRFTASNYISEQFMLPYEIYQALPGWRPSGQTQPTWWSRDLALAALSDACVRVIGERRQAIDGRAAASADRLASSVPRA